MGKLYISDSTNKHRISKMFGKGLLVKVCRNIYISKNDIDDLPEIISQNILTIFTILNVRGNVAYSTALTYPEADNNTYILTSGRIKNITLEGFGFIKVYKANEREANKKHMIPIQGADGCFLPFPSRGILENFSKRKFDAKKISKELGKKKIKKIIELCQGDITKVDKFIENIKLVSKDVGFKDECDEVLEIVSQYSEEFMQNFKGYKYDVKRLDKLKEFKKILLQHDFNNVPTIDYFNERIVENLSFFESYFSNYIEGTKFTIDEAVNIMINKTSYDRHKDGNDILKHRELTKNETMLFDLSSEEAFLRTLKSTHLELLSHRGEIAGTFKEKNNQAGDRVFVLVDLVEGTLREAYQLVKGMPTVAKAILLTIAFLETHPFEDGNGRLGRLLMNSILKADGYQRIIVPTVLREDYILGLKSFTINSNYKALIRLFEKLFDVNGIINYDNKIEFLIEFLDGKNAFADSSDGNWGEARQEQYEMEEEFNFLL